MWKLTFGKSKPTCSLSKFDLRRTVSVKWDEYLTNSNIIFRTLNKLKKFHQWWSNLNTLFLTSNELTSNIIGVSLDWLNYSFDWLDHHFFEHWTNSNVFIYCKSISNTTFLALNHQTLNFEHSSTHHYWLETRHTLGHFKTDIRKSTYFERPKNDMSKKEFFIARKLHSNQRQ